MLMVLQYRYIISAETRLSFIEAHNDKYKGTRREDPSLKSVYVLLSALKENENTIIPVQFEIKEFIDKENKLYLAVTLNKIEVNISGQTFAELSDENNPPLTSDISITEIIKNINPMMIMKLVLYMCVRI